MNPALLSGISSCLKHAPPKAQVRDLNRRMMILIGLDENSSSTNAETWHPYLPLAVSDPYGERHRQSQNLYPIDFEKPVQAINAGQLLIPPDIMLKAIPIRKWASPWELENDIMDACSSERVKCIMFNRIRQLSADQMYVPEYGPLRCILSLGFVLVPVHNRKNERPPAPAAAEGMAGALDSTPHARRGANTILRAPSSPDRATPTPIGPGAARGASPKGKENACAPSQLVPAVGEVRADSPNQNTFSPARSSSYEIPNGSAAPGASPVAPRTPPAQKMLHYGIGLATSPSPVSPRAKSAFGLDSVAGTPSTAATSRTFAAPQDKQPAPSQPSLPGGQPRPDPVDVVAKEWSLESEAKYRQALAFPSGMTICDPIGDFDGGPRVMPLVTTDDLALFKKVLFADEDERDMPRECMYSVELRVGVRQVIRFGDAVEFAGNAQRPWNWTLPRRHVVPHYGDLRNFVDVFR